MVFIRTNLFLVFILPCSVTTRPSGVTPRLFDIRKPHNNARYRDLPRQRARVRNVNFSVILYVGKLTLDSDVKKKVRTYYYRIWGFLQGNTSYGLQVLCCRSGCCRNNNNKKQALLFPLWLLLFSLVVKTLPPSTYFICRSFSRQISCFNIYC